LGKCRKTDLSSLDAKSLTARNGNFEKMRNYLQGDLLVLWMIGAESQAQFYNKKPMM
jgi:hypothetical protein